MESLSGMICRVLRALKTRECRCGELYALEGRVRHAFSTWLRNGVTIVPEAMREYSGGVLHTVITVDQLNDDCAVTGVAITFFVGGTLNSLDFDMHGNIRFCYVDGKGKAFKFLRHDPLQGALKRGDFPNEGFQYASDALALYLGTNGTIARVKGDADPYFIVNGLCTVSSGRIEDLRYYADSGKIVDDVRVLYEDLVSDDLEEWDRVFGLLFS